MFLDEPFVPEIVEQQIADLQESAQDRPAQPQTSNLRLIQNLQQISQACQADSEGMNHAYQRLFQQEDHSTVLTDRKTSSLNGTLSNPSSGNTANGPRRRPFWRSRLIAAMLLIGVILIGSFVFTLSHLSAPSSVQRTSAPTASQNSAGLNEIGRAHV